MCSVWPSVCRWKAVDSFVSMPSNPFNSFIKSTVNCGPLSEIILSGNPCNYHTLSLNNLASPSAVVFSVVSKKYTILVKWSTTTSILLYPCAKGNLLIKSAEIWPKALSGIKFGINFPAGCSVWFLLFWQTSHPSTYRFTSLVTPSHQKFLVANSAVFHCLPLFSYRHIVITPASKILAK